MSSAIPLPRSRPLMQQAESLALILGEEFGVPFALYDGATQAPLPTGAPADAAVGPELIARAAEAGQPQVVALTPGQHHLLIPFRDSEDTTLVAVGAMAGFARGRAEWHQEQGRLARWAQAVRERIQSVARRKAPVPHAAAPDGQQGLAWETLLALDGLLRKVRPQTDPAGNHKRTLAAAAQVLGVDALAWVPRAPEGEVVLAGEAGLTARDGRQLATLLEPSADWDKAGILLHNRVEAHSWDERLARVGNLMALRVLDPALPGWVIAVNKRAARAPGREAGEAPLVPFRRGDAAVLTPFLAVMGSQLRVARRLQELKELLVGLTRSLTSAIDAKDPYTYGHSERVARVAVELGRELGLPEEQLSDIYLAGLLHDIGKIGVRDAVLGKTAPLTDEERAHIRQHVTIGYQILADLRSVSHLLPGVLYHHERWDGGGYPDGLRGEAIPLLARILAVADSYDAMSTNRPYRAGMPPARVEEVLKDGAGQQWDADVVAAFLRVKQKVHAIRQRGLGESLRHALDGDLRERGRPADGSSVAHTPPG